MSTKSDPLSDIDRDFDARLARGREEGGRASRPPSSPTWPAVAARSTAASAALEPSMKFAGPALTVEVRPGDNLMIHAAMAIAKPGDVLVVDGKGDQTCALMGAIMMNECKKIGIAGVILDAAVPRQRGDPPSWTFRCSPSARIRMGRPSSSPVGSTSRSRSAGSRSARATSSWPMRTASSSSSARRRNRCSRSQRRRSPTKPKRIEAIRKGESLRPAWLDGALRAAGVLKEGETL